MAIQACPHYSQFYLMYAKDKWVVDGDTDRAKEILSDGLELNPQTEDLWFALAKLQWKTGERDECIQTFIKCRDTVIEPTARAWYKQVTLERVLEHYSEALDLVDEGLQSHPSEPKLYLQMGEVYESLKQWDQAKDAYEMGTKACKSSTLLWIHLARVYNERLGKKKIKARSTLEEAMALNPKDDLLYLERLDLEGRGTEAAQVILSKGLKEIPKSAILWAERIRSSRPQQRKNLYSLALNNTNDNPIVILAVARDLWTRGKLPKAKQFFDACISKDPDFGDAYVYYHWFLEKHGEIEEVESLEKQFIDNDPHHGPLWSPVLKNIPNIDKDSLHLLRAAADDVSGETTNGSATKSTDAV
ncbi:DEKNAAC103736 [Brettanomyces naardenensis]|uniref:DEKNAAC103736 n=1 Tax=Brettanomyces naardenensis TaxID=13370 RepID=A0A448YP75_BRENA|nr:DEKNAAC103736 [Brettanomyces naardenensis]